MQNLKKTKFILGNQNIFRLFLIILLNLLQTILEILSLSLIIPIITSIIEPDLTESSKFINLLFNYLGSENNIDFLKSLLLVLFILYSCKLLLSILFKFLHVKFQFYLVRFVTIKIIKKYLSLDYEYYLKNKSSKMISTLYNEGSAFIDWYISPIIVIVSEFIFILSIVILLLYVDVKSTLIIISIFLLFTIIFLFSTRSQILKWGKSRQKLAEILIKNLVEIFDGIKVIKIFQKEKLFLNIFATNQKKMQALAQNNDVILFLPRVLLEYLVLISIITILYITTFSSSDLSNKIPIIALYAAAALKMIPTASKIMVSFQNLKFGAPTIDRVYEEIKTQNNLNEIKQNFKEDFKSIVFKNITSYYEKDKIILNNVSFDINKGDFIGLVGQSGSGKTTFLNIVLGLIKPRLGKIEIDGQDITNNYSNLRSLFSLVSQDVFLFDDNISANIALEPDESKVDKNKLDKVLNLSQLKDLVKIKKNIADIEVGEKGISISGGQKQRISIARALYKDSKIIVFDEATSNLDIEMEERIIEAMKPLKGKKTMIFVSHRPSSLKICDKIFTIEDKKLKKLN